MKKFFALFMMVVFVLGTLVLPASAASQVTFHVNPTDATVTFNGVTRQAANGVVSFEAEAGTYDCQVARTGYVWQEGTVTVEGNSEYLVTLVADSAKSYWTFDDSLEGWTCNLSADTLSHEDGALKLAMASNDPGVSKGITPNLDMTGRDRAVLTYRKVAASESDLLIYFSSVVNGTSYGNSGSRALTKTLPAQTDGYVTEVFPANEYFAGTLENLRIDPITSASGLTGAAFYIDKLEIPKIAALELTAATSHATFYVSPADAEVTLNGVTRQAADGVVTFATVDGTYDCQVAKTGYVWQEGTVAVEGNSEYTVTLAEDSAKSYWTFDEDLEGWTSSTAGDTLSHEDGALKLEMASNDPSLVLATVNLDMTGRDRAVLTYRKTAAIESDLLIYFKSEVNGTSYNHSSSRALTKSLPAETAGYVTEVFPANEYFAGTLENLRVDPITSASGLTDAVFSMDKLEIPKIAPLVTSPEPPALYENVKYTISSAEGENKITLNVAVSGLKATAGSLALAFDNTKVALANQAPADVTEVVTAADKIGVVATAQDEDNIEYVSDSHILFTWYSTDGVLDATADSLAIASIEFDVLTSLDEINNSTFSLYDLQEGDFMALEHRAEVTDDAPYAYYENGTEPDGALTVEFTYTGADKYPVTFVGAAGTSVTVGEKTFRLGENGSYEIALSEGSYTYSAVLDGYASLENVPFTVGTAGNRVVLQQEALGGTITFDIDYLANATRDMTVVVTPKAGGDSTTVTGYGTAEMELLPGEYTVTISAPGCLRYTGELTVTGSAAFEAGLSAGDINSDDRISNLDLAYVILAFDKTSDFGLADMTGDGQMTLEDITAVTVNAGKSVK